MADPASADEYLARFNANQKMEGYGIAGVTMRLPCPFCAAADFLVYRVVDAREAMAKGATCVECGRSAAAVFDEGGPAGSIAFEIVQTGGPDPADWLQPKMRRLLP